MKVFEILNEKNVFSNLVATLNKGRTEYRLWKNGADAFTLSDADPSGKFQISQTFKGKSLEEVVASLKKDGYKQVKIVSENHQANAKITVPGWYVTDEEDKVIAGPMTEKEAEKQARRRLGNEASYFSDYAIRRMMEK